jgi:colanic acid/amylovoran biosynthesis protein
VAVVPNVRIGQHIGETGAETVYKGIIEALVEAGKNVYLLWHSSDDEKLCRNLERVFRGRGVELVDADLDCFELRELIMKFDFIVASRYHSIVHAYRHGVPVVAIGWAVKYRELLSDFGQADYHVEPYSAADAALATAKVKKMLAHYGAEAKVISQVSRRLRSENSLENFLSPQNSENAAC